MNPFYSGVSIIGFFCLGYVVSTLDPFMHTHPEINQDVTDPARACLFYIGIGSGWCYDSLIFSGTAIAAPLLSLLSVLRLRREMQAHQQMNILLNGSNQVMELMARHSPRHEVLTAIINLLQQEQPGIFVSLLITHQESIAGTHASNSAVVKALIRKYETCKKHEQPGGTGVNPGLPCSYCDFDFNHSATPCMLAYRRKASVYAGDDPDAEPLARECMAGARFLGIIVIWSEPVLSDHGEVLAIVNFYYRRGNKKNSHDEELMAMAVNMITVSIEQESRASEAKLMRSLIELNPDPVYLISPEQGFRLCYVNEAAVQHFGYSRAKVLTLKISGYDPNYHDEKKIERNWQQLKTCGSYVIESEHRVANGLIIPVQINSFYLQHEGKEYIAGSFKDISERIKTDRALRVTSDLAETSLISQKQAESRTSLLEAIIRFSSFPKYLIDPHDEFRLVYINEAGAEHFGYPPEYCKKLRIIDFDPMVTPEQLESIWETLKITESVTFQTRHNTLHEQNIPVEVYAHYLHHEGRDYIAGYFQNITERLNKENQIIAAKTEAEQALAVKNRFLALMSHELRTPLNAILGFSQLAQETDSPIVLREYMDRIYFSGTNLLSLITDILDFTHIDEQNQIADLKPFSIRKLLQELFERFQSRSKAKKLILGFDIQDTVPEYVLGDVARIRQILLNLLDNALRFTSTGGIKLLVEKSLVEPENRISWTVADTGIGIDCQHHERIFEPFVQVDEGDNRATGGGGLGLALSRKLVILMGGDGITVRSTPGAGATFSFELPLKSIRNDDERSLPTPIKPDLSLRGLHILIAEDNHINQLVLKAMMEKHGAEVSVADDGLQAVVLLESHPREYFDAILMDIQMPVMDGYAATRKIRQELGMKDIPIIAVTANSTANDKKSSFEAGMNAFITKPVHKDQLLATVLGLLPYGTASTLPLYTAALPNQPVQTNPFEVSVLYVNQILKNGIKNLSSAINKLDGDELLYKEMARLFLEDYAGAVEEISGLISAGNEQEAVSMIHTLKGLASTLGLTDLNQAASALEAVLEADHHDQLEESIGVLYRQMDCATQALNRILLTEKGIYFFK
ncbi:MAG: ATP-binding protein [Methylococcaceae bacterium]